MKRVTTHEAKTHLSRLIDLVLQGESIIICRGKTPVAQLTAVNGNLSVRPKVGTVSTEAVNYTADAFEPLTRDDLASEDMES